MRLGTRGSPLALAQADARRAGDSAAARSSRSQPAATEGAAGGDKRRWVDADRARAARREIDLAVHSAKDVPGELADGLELLGAPARAARGRAVHRAGRRSVGAANRSAWTRLPAGARVGTSSLRRAAQLRAAREDLEVVAVRGNVDTRLRKLGEGGFDAIVLARAGLQRLGREAEIGAVLDPARFVPAPGQGTLALEGRADDDATRGGRAGDRRRRRVRLPAGRARARARARGKLQHAARRARRRLRLRLPAAARLGRACPTARPGSATSCWAASTTPRRSGAAWRSGSSSAGAGDLLRRWQMATRRGRRVRSADTSDR